MKMSSAMMPGHLCGTWQVAEKKGLLPRGSEGEGWKLATVLC